MKRALIGSPPVSLLNAGFVPGPTFLRFGGDDESGAGEHGKIGRVPIAARCNEGVHRRRHGIVAEYADDGISKGGFAGAAVAVG